MPDIGRLDGAGVLVAIEPVSIADHRTDPEAGTVALPVGHDMRERLGAYRWDDRAGTFLPLDGEPSAPAPFTRSSLIDVLVRALPEVREDEVEDLTAAVSRAVDDFRRSRATTTQGA